MLSCILLLPILASPLMVGRQFSLKGEIFLYFVRLNAYDA